MRHNFLSTRARLAALQAADAEPTPQRMPPDSAQGSHARAPPPPSAPPAAAAHAPVDKDDPAVAALGECAPAYAALEACLGERGRDWRRCQDEVAALRECSARRGAPADAEN